MLTADDLRTGKHSCLVSDADSSTADSNQQPSKMTLATP